MNLRAWAFLALAVVLGTICVRLGFWQLSRLEERRNRIASVEAGLERPALDLSEAAGGPIEPYRRAVARGSFSLDGQFLLSPRSYQDQPGYHLVTPLHLDGASSIVLVDRGWIPYEQRDRLADYRIEGSVELHGVTKPAQSSPSFLFGTATSGDVLPTERQTMDLPAIQTAFDAPLLQVYLALESAPAGAGPAPVPQPELELSEGPHLGYAVQWFGFAAVAYIGGVYWVWKRHGADGQS